MNQHIGTLAFQGDWNRLLPLLRKHPDLINTPSERKAYTPLHQAAWHGADPAVAGELLALGASRSLTTSKGQTAQAIARKQHPDRGDLEWILAPGNRSLSQLLRKVVADNRDFFGDYDGNRVVCDRLIEFFCSDWSNRSATDAVERVEAALRAVLDSLSELVFMPAANFEFRASSEFWRERFLPALNACARRAHVIPIEEHWAVVSDLFDPAPESWGLRGDLFLWMELRQALCHVEIPREPDALAQTIAAAHRAFTGADLIRGECVSVKHLARGGMSSGAVAGEFWTDHFIPLLQRRASWLRATWVF